MDFNGVSFSLSLGIVFERGEGISELSAQPTQWAELKAGRSKIEDRGDRGAGSI